MRRRVGFFPVENRASPGGIFSSPDPRAVHRYVSAGFDLHPTAVAYGPVRKAVDMQAGVRKGSLDDLRYVSDIDRAVREADNKFDTSRHH